MIFRLILVIKQLKRSTASGEEPSPGGAKDAGPKAEFGWKDIPKGFHWLFKKNELEKSLEALKGWNNQLQSIPEMNGQDVIKMIGDALKRGNYEGLKFFEGRATLRKIADPNKSSKLDREGEATFY